MRACDRSLLQLCSTFCGKLFGLQAESAARMHHRDSFHKIVHHVMCQGASTRALCGRFDLSCITWTARLIMRCAVGFGHQSDRAATHHLKCETRRLGDVLSRKFVVSSCNGDDRYGSNRSFLPIASLRGEEAFTLKVAGVTGTASPWVIVRPGANFRRRSTQTNRSSDV